MKHLVLSVFASLAIAATALPVSAQDVGGSRDNAIPGAGLPGPAHHGAVRRVDDGSARNALGGSSRTTVQVTAEQRASIRRKLDVAGGQLVSKSSLGGAAIAIGATMPREKVHIARLPPEIVQLVPEYASYEYFLTDDGLIVIVDPDSYEVVDVLDA